MISDRIRLGYDLAKMSRLIKNQKDLSNKIISQKGSPVSQSYVSQVINGLLPQIPTEFIEQLTEKFQFFNSQYIIHGTGHVFNYKGLIEYINENYFEKTFSPLEDKQAVIEEINKTYNLAIPYDRIFGSKEDHVPRETDQHLERVLELVDTLRRTRAVHTDKEFCQICDIHPQVLVNMRGRRNSDVSKETLCKILVAWPNVSTDWLILGKGDMFRNEKDIYHLIDGLSDAIRRIESKIL